MTKIELVDPNSKAIPLADRLKYLFETFSDNAGKIGPHKIRPYNQTRGLSGILSLPNERIAEITRNLEACVEATNFVLSNSAEKPSGHMFLWRVLRQLGFVPSDDLFEHLNEDTCIEVYDNRGVWVYGNLNFYEITSYSLAELYEFPWHALWHRNELDQARTYALGEKLLAGQVTKTLFNPLPTHVVREDSAIDGIESECEYEMELTPTIVAPLYYRRTKEIAGFIHSFHKNWIRATKAPDTAYNGSPSLLDRTEKDSSQSYN